MKADGTFRITRPRPRRKWRHLVAQSMPVVVWLAAILAAIKVHDQLGVPSRIWGYAEDASVTVTHLEPGTVRTVMVQEHDIVEQGQLLVTLDATKEFQREATIQKDIERLRSEVLAEADRIAAENIPTDPDHGDLLRAFLIDRETAHIEYLTQVMTNARDRIQLRAAEVEFDLVQRLRDRGDAAFRELDEIEASVITLREQLEKNEAVLARKKEAFTQADMCWHNFQEQGVGAIPFDPVITPLRLAAEVREAELNEVYQRIESHFHRAPIAGQVTRISARPGDQILSGAPLVTLSALRTDRGIAYLAEKEILSAQAGDRVVVRRIAAGQGDAAEFMGTIASMSSAVIEAPIRFRTSPAWPIWGRPMTIVLDSKALLPGEAISIVRIED